MIEIDYRRWGILKSKQAFFCDHVPLQEGYHFVICTNCYHELDHQHFDKRKEQHTVIVDLSQDSDKIFAQVHRNKRKMIKRGSKLGYEVTYLTPTTSLLREFKRLYNKSMVKRGATPIITVNYFEALMPYMTFIRTMYEGQTLGMMQLIHDGKIVRAHRLAYNEDIDFDREVRNYLGAILWWKALMHFKQLGYQTFDFGGIELHQISSSQGYTRFKLAFGGQIITTFWYEIANTPIAHTSMKLMQFVEYNLRRILQKVNR